MDITVGEKIPLSVQLADDETGRFIIATVRDHFGTEVSGSPATLSHIANGLYEDLSVSMPTTRVTASYRTYCSLSPLKRDPKYPTHTEMFLVKQPAAQVSVIVSPINLKGTIQGKRLEGQVTFNELSGVLKRQSVIGRISDDLMKAKQASDKLVGSLKSKDTKGKITC